MAVPHPLHEEPLPGGAEAFSSLSSVVPLEAIVFREFQELQENGVQVRKPKRLPFCGEPLELIADAWAISAGRGGRVVHACRQKRGISDGGLSGVAEVDLGLCNDLPGQRSGFTREQLRQAGRDPNGYLFGKSGSRPPYGGSAGSTRDMTHTAFRPEWGVDPTQPILLEPHVQPDPLRSKPAGSRQSENESPQL